MLLCVIPYNSQGSDSGLLKGKIPGKLVVGYNECLLYRAVEKVSHRCMHRDICGTGLSEDH